MEAAPPERESPGARLPLATVAREWLRIGVIGFGGPPAHIALLRRRLVEERRWLEMEEFEAAIAACNLLPGPASTQLAIYCAYRLAGRRGAVVGGLAFIVPAVVIVTALSVLFLAKSPPQWVRGAGEGAGAAVAAVAVAAALALLRPSWSRAVAAGGPRRVRWAGYVVLGAAAGALLGPFLVLVLVGCGAVEVWVELRRRGGRRLLSHPLAALLWVAFKVGALSYGGGFVIIPLMQDDAVHVYHWMTSGQFLNAVALGQVSPGPVVATVAAVGYAAHGVLGAALASAMAFTPSFLFVLTGGSRFRRLRHWPPAMAFLNGAGPAAIGAILGAAVPLAAALAHGWQFGVLAAAAVVLLLLRRGVVETLMGAGVVGVVVALAGGPV
ncbi:MAG TPA: chromate transporter [Solirubrobacteraceae bacterium]|nr:chromate transporter [Solirubrobacteraceae bacterium]